VKICGLSTSETLETALSAGAAFVGLVHYPRSPRHVDRDAAAALAALARGRANTVLLLVDPADALLDDIVGTVRPDFIQLHGSESAGRVRDVRQRTGVPVIKALQVASTDDVRAAEAYRQVAAFPLFDARVLAAAPGLLPGGNGIAFDWTLLAGEAVRGPYMLSGGLNPANVAEALRLTAAPMVDVSSGVESSPGVKDHALIRSFITAATRQVNS
jgi:phosphoribosylanthranilate isomerase